MDKIMFYNRKVELEYLESKYGSCQAELLIFWGRRRVGKTFLLQEFCNRKHGIFLMATTSSSRDNLESFAEKLATRFNDERLRVQPFVKWDEFFLYLNEKIQQRTLVVIDEYPYLIENNPSLSSLFQKYWDSVLQNNPGLMLILNGSAIAMMERETLEYRAPLYGRRTGQWFLDTFDPVSTNEFFGFTRLIQIIEAYSITSGIPYYCKILCQQPDLFSAIRNKILMKGEVLYDEIEFLLRQEFRTPRSYFPILKTIAQGGRKFGEISSKTGYDKSNLTKYLSTLEKLRIIRREAPITETRPEKSRKNLYFLNDNFINFWFTFVFPNRYALEAGKSEQVMQAAVRPNFDYYVSQRVEPIIIALLRQDFFNCGLNFKSIGRYWNKNTEIDIWGETTGNQLIIGEIKWTEVPCRKSVFYNLVEKVGYLNLNKKITYLLISKSGFSEDYQKLDSNNLILIDLSKYKLGGNA